MLEKIKFFLYLFHTDEKQELIVDVNANMVKNGMFFFCEKQREQGSYSNSYAYFNIKTTRDFETFLCEEGFNYLEYTKLEMIEKINFFLSILSTKDYIEIKFYTKFDRIALDKNRKWNWERDRIQNYKIKTSEAIFIRVNKERNKITLKGFYY